MKLWIVWQVMVAFNRMWSVPGRFEKKVFEWFQSPHLRGTGDIRGCKPLTCFYIIYDVYINAFTYKYIYIDIYHMKIHIYLHIYVYIFIYIKYIRLMD